MNNSPNLLLIISIVVIILLVLGALFYFTYNTSKPKVAVIRTNTAMDRQMNNQDNYDIPMNNSPLNNSNLYKVEYGVQ